MQWVMVDMFCETGNTRHNLNYDRLSIDSQIGYWEQSVGM